MFGLLWVNRADDDDDNDDDDDEDDDEDDWVKAIVDKLRLGSKALMFSNWSMGTCTWVHARMSALGLIAL